MIDLLSNNVVIFLVGQVVTAAAIWGGIRVDLRNIHQRVSDVKVVADEAHKRIDKHLDHQAGRYDNS